METVVSILIPAIVENVFGALTEAVGLSDWLRQRLGRDPEKLAFHQALTQALTDSATHYPGRDLRYFAEILRDIGGPLLARTLQPAAPLPTADELTNVWLNHLTVDSLIHYRAEFTQFAIHFLDRLQFHLENKQSLRWIAQARYERSNEETIRRMADAAEQSATNIEALRQEVARLTATLTSVLQTNSGSTVTTEGESYNAGTISAQNFAGRDLTINQYFVQGLARLVFNYSARIENFLFEYLGGQGQRVPFGGRQKQIDQLNTWLDDPDAAPYLLMVAEAGGGKSALVTRWSAQLTTRTDLEVIFVPISIRFQTAAQDVAFASLAARLAQIYEQQSTLPAALSAEQWKGQCETYLRLPLPARKRLLVIIDGLDEATGWEAGPELFAKRPPAGLRILVTARTRAKEIDADRWAVRLGWQNDQIARKLHLPGLDHHGIAEALVSMGNPLDHLATQVDLVSELHRLSKGDPLVVRLYVEALQEMGAAAARLRPEDLADIEPGLDGFMERWWADQRKQWQMQGKDPFTEEERLLPFLHACTIACGPLLLNDLAELDKQHFGKGLLVTHMAELLGRWIIGDGKKQGYVFNHPRLRNYFSERLTPDEEREWQDKFCNWGRRILTALNTGTLDPKQTPEYLLRYYSTHLERNQAPMKVLCSLVNNGWRLAWENLDVSHCGFLNDMNLVWKQTLKINDFIESKRADVLVEQLKILLCWSSVSTLYANLTPELLALAIECDLYTPTQVLAITKLLSDEQQQSDALVMLIPHFTEDLLYEALAIAREMKNQLFQIKIMSKLIPYLPELPRMQVVQEALVIVQKIPDDYTRVSNLIILVPYLHDALQEAVFSVVLEIQDAFARVHALASLIPYISNDRRKEIQQEALTFARDIKDISYRADALTTLLINWQGPNHIPVAWEALGIAQRIQNPSFCAITLSRLIPHLPEKQRYRASGTTLAAIKSIKDENFRAFTLSKVTPHLPKKYQIRALAIAREIRSDTERLLALGAVIPYLPELLHRQVLAEVLTNLRTIQPFYHHVAASCKILPHLSDQTRKLILSKVLKSAYEIDNLPQRVLALVSLYPHLSELSRREIINDALSIAKKVDDEAFRLAATNALETYYPSQFSDCKLTMSFIDRNYLSSILVTEGAEPNDNKVIEGILSSMNQSKSDEVYQAKSWIAVAPLLHEPERSDLLAKSLQILQSVENITERSYLLSELAPRFAAWASHSPNCAYMPLINMLQNLSANMRPVFLQDLVALMPFILALAGDEAPQAAEGIYHAIQEVCGWWP